MGETHGARRVQGTRLPCPLQPPALPESPRVRQPGHSRTLAAEELLQSFVCSSPFPDVSGSACEFSLITSLSDDQPHPETLQGSHLSHLVSNHSGAQTGLLMNDRHSHH